MDGAERRFANLGPLGTDIKVVKNQIGELKNFKSDIDPQMVKVEALNRYIFYLYFKMFSELLLIVLLIYFTAFNGSYYYIEV